MISTKDLKFYNKKNGKISAVATNIEDVPTGGPILSNTGDITGYQGQGSLRMTKYQDGHQNQVSGRFCMVLGTQNLVDQDHSLVMGQRHHLILDEGKQGSCFSAGGNDNVISVGLSSAIGHNLRVNIDEPNGWKPKIGLGLWNKDKKDTVLIVGNGTSETSRSNALEVYYDGGASIGSYREKQVAQRIKFFGTGLKNAKTDDQVILGKYNNPKGFSSVEFGAGTSETDVSTPLSISHQNSTYFKGEGSGNILPSQSTTVVSKDGFIFTRDPESNQNPVTKGYLNRVTVPAAVKAHYSLGLSNLYSGGSGSVNARWKKFASITSYGDTSSFEEKSVSYLINVKGSNVVGGYGGGKQGILRLSLGQRYEFSVVSGEDISELIEYKVSSDIQNQKQEISFYLVDPFNDSLTFTITKLLDSDGDSTGLVEDFTDNWTEIDPEATKVEFTAEANTIAGFRRSGSSPTWGIETGTAIAEFITEEDQCAFYFRKNCPERGQLSLVIDGTVYTEEGKKRVLTGEPYKNIAAQRVTSIGLYAITVKNPIGEEVTLMLSIYDLTKIAKSYFYTGQAAAPHDGIVYVPGDRVIKTMNETSSILDVRFVLDYPSNY